MSEADLWLLAATITVLGVALVLLELNEQRHLRLARELDEQRKALRQQEEGQ